jgi:predicted ArsR family transcriptional regulator
MLARMLLRAAANAGAAPADAEAAGREQGAEEAARTASPRPCAAALVALLDRLGFDPERVDEDGATTIGFTHCPFRELAEANPDLVCSLHRGLVAGFVDGVGGAAVTAFGSLVDRHPCRVTLVEH